MPVTGLGHGDAQPTIVAVDGPSPARLYTTLCGALLVIAGIVGFFYSASFGSPGEVGEILGAFAVNGWTNVLYVLAGTIGLLAADYGSRPYAMCIGLIFVVIAAWGFTIGSGDSILGFLPVNTADTVFSLVLGLLGIGAAMATPKAKPKPASATA